MANPELDNYVPQGKPTGLSEDAKELWSVLVMLKREFDRHETKKGFLQIPTEFWEEAVSRSQSIKARYENYSG